MIIVMMFLSLYPILYQKIPHIVPYIGKVRFIIFYGRFIIFVVRFIIFR